MIFTYASGHRGGFPCRFMNFIAEPVTAILKRWYAIVPMRYCVNNAAAMICENLSLPMRLVPEHRTPHAVQYPVLLLLFVVPVRVRPVTDRGLLIIPAPLIFIPSYETDHP